MRSAPWLLMQSPQPNAATDGLKHDLDPRFWAILVLTAIGAGLGGAALMALLRLAEHCSWHYSAGVFLHAVQRASSRRRVVVLLLAGIIAGMGRWLLRLATGGHGGELSEAIWFRAGHLPFWRTLMRAALSIVIVGMGASLGREGAPKQSGAAIASRLADWSGLPPAQRRLLAACGAGAGLAAVYNIPLGGALFALEVLLGTLTLPLVIPALTASLIATAVSWVYLPIRPTYHIPVYPLAASQVIWALIAGPIAGLLGVLYTRFIGWADRLKPRGALVVAAPIAVFALLGALAIVYPQLLGNGKDAVQEAFTARLSLPLLLALLVLKPLATASCLGSGAPGGLFTPTLTYGSMLGGVLGWGWERLWPGAAPATYAIIGGCAVLGATMQAPLAALVMVLELTHRIDGLMVPLMLAVATATLVAGAIDPRSIYSNRVGSGKQIEVYKRALDERFAGWLRSDPPVISCAARPAEINRRFTQDVRALYVLDERGRLVGKLSPGSTRAASDIATAADLVQPAPSVETSLPAQEIERRLRASPGRDLPLIDSESGRLIGILMLDGDHL